MTARACYRASICSERSIKRLGVKKSALWLVALAGATLACSAPQSADSTGGDSGGAPRQGGVLRLRSTTDITDFDISTAPKTSARSVASYVYNRLLSNRTGPDVPYEDFTLAPELAERWELSPDATAFTFHLRRGVKFHDIAPVNGRELTSADVKWSYEYWSRGPEFQGKKLPASQYQWFFENLSSIDTPDPWTVTVRFKSPFAPFMSYAASQYNAIAPHEVFDADGHFKEKAVGTGPFMLDAASSQTGSRWVFRRNPGYWKEGLPYLDTLQELVIVDDSSAEAAFRAKQIDFLDAPSCHEAERLRQAQPDTGYFEGVSVAPLNIYINTRVRPLGDVRVRKALALGINRDEIITALQCGKGEPALSGALSDTFTVDERRKMLRHDPAEAKRLLAQAGFGGGVDIEWLYTKEYGELYQNTVTLLQAQLRQVGINLNLKLTTRADVQAARRTADRHMLTATTKTLESDVESFLYQMYHPNSTNNYGGIS
ncbi:MAG: ABC transporter substrate-binding protein, partial [Dehalococcoidia bacterium]|nr:ABC transporter substrate-binding protein [Dehalococcoidia bacterium]